MAAPKLPPSPAATYRQAQLNARALAGSLSQDAALDIEKAMRAYAKKLAASIATLPADQATALVASRKVILSAADDLAASIQIAVSSNRALSFAEVAGAWEYAGEQAASYLGTIPTAALGGVMAPSVTLAGAYEALGGAAVSWQTRLTGYVQASAQDADEIVRLALLNGVGTEELAKALRPYVAGAKEFHDAFGAEAFSKLRDLRAQNVPQGSGGRRRSSAPRPTASPIPRYGTPAPRPRSHTSRPTR